MYDLLVVGGGINGAGIARDATGRGLSVLLCEQDDLAGHTSSASSKLVHGGLRYLEYYEFRLVAKALAEREVLLRAAPHIIWPMRFVMPHVRSLRPAWMIRAGLFLYDHLDFGKRKLLPGSRGVDLRRHPAGGALRGEYRHGFEYSDAWADDARLVILNALDASERGAEIHPRTRCVRARREQGAWMVTLQTNPGGREWEVQARGLVNAAGPWVSSFLEDAVRESSGHRVRQVKGSHMVVPKLFDHEYAYIFQNVDKRIVFALPFEGDFTLVGTTEVGYRDDPADAGIDDEEIAYLCDICNRYFERDTGPGDVVWTFSGVRPLMDDEEGNLSAVTRDYRLELHADDAPLLSVFGGKLTTFRKLAEEVVDMLAPVLGFSETGWTGNGAPLPGGNIADADFEGFLADAGKRYPWMPDDLLRRYGRAYGTRIDRVIGTAGELSDLGEHFGHGLYEAEVRYLVEHEWARTAEDVLWRRSKMGLHAPVAVHDRLRAWMREIDHDARAAAG
jgi:glycerol-3-phosphate dehydrogenase